MTRPKAISSLPRMTHEQAARLKSLAQVAYEPDAYKAHP
jgi:hypothetical protein